MFKNIIVPVDGSEASLVATEYAADMSVRYKGSLTLLHVIPRIGSDRVPEELRELAKIEHVEPTEADVLKNFATKILRKAQDHAEFLQATEIHTVIESGNPAKMILAYCDKHDVDLIVMGRRGLGDLASLLMGSVSTKVTHLAKCPCMTVL